MEVKTKSGQKISKKTRQIFRREVREGVHTYVREHLKALKPKPRFVPLFVWKRVVAAVIDVEGLERNLRV